MLHSKLVIPTVDTYQTWATSDLMREFQSLTRNNQHDTESIETALKHLAIIREVAARIEKKSSRYRMPAEMSMEASSNDCDVLTLSSYFFILSFGIFQRSVGAYLFGSTLFLLIPHISSPALITLSLLFVALDSLLFYAFEVSFLKSIMGMSDEYTERGLLDQIYLEQRKSAKTINRLLNHVDSLVWDPRERQAFIGCKEVFNQHLLEKLECMQAPKRTWLKVCLEYAVIAFGALSSITDSYFAFTVLHLSLLTPLGATLALGMVISGLVLYYGMGVQSVNKLINPDLESYEVLKEKLSKFKAEFGVVSSSSESVSRSSVFAMKSNLYTEKCHRRDDTLYTSQLRAP